MSANASTREYGEGRGRPCTMVTGEVPIKMQDFWLQIFRVFFFIVIFFFKNQFKRIPFKKVYNMQGKSQNNI